MKVIENKKIENVRYIFGSPSTAKSRYNQIKRTFPESDEYKIFAEPVFVQDTNSIIWSTDFDGSIINYSKLSPTDQVIAEKLLSKSIQNILSIAKTFETNELTEFIYNCIEIPSMQNVYLVRGKQGDKVVLTEWGFVSDTPGMEKGLLAKIISVKRVPMVFDIIFKDNKTPAPNRKFFFEFEGQTQTFYSDANGKITLQDVKVDEEVKVYEKDGDTNINEQSFICYENGKYKIEVERFVDMPFKVINENNEPVPGETFTFEFNGEQKTLTADSEGRITLPQIKVGTEVAAFQQNEEKQLNKHNFICEADKEYILKIKSPEEPIYNMRIKVIDPKGEVVPNAKVKISYEGKTVELFSDAEGFVVLEDVKPQTQVKVVAIGKKQKKKKQKDNELQKETEKN